MLYLFLAILSNVTLAVLIKQLEAAKISASQTILFNYFICVLAAWVHLGEFPLDQDTVSQVWFPCSLVTGIFFLLSFNFLALSFNKAGISMTIITQKMSLILVLLFSLMFYKEPMNWLKFLGLFFALLTIILVNYKTDVEKQKGAMDRLAIFYLSGTFLLSGGVDISLQYAETSLLEQSGDPRFAAMSFFTAGIFGLVFFVFNWIRGKIQFDPRAILPGILLALVNYGALVLLLKTLNLGWGGSFVFPILNVGIIVLSTTLGYFIYKEKLNRWNIVGLICSVLAILFIAIGQGRI